MTPRWRNCATEFVNFTAYRQSVMVIAPCIVCRPRDELLQIGCVLGVTRTDGRSNEHGDDRMTVTHTVDCPSPPLSQLTTRCDAFVMYMNLVISSMVMLYWFQSGPNEPSTHQKQLFETPRNRFILTIRHNNVKISIILLCLIYLTPQFIHPFGKLD